MIRVLVCGDRFWDDGEFIWNFLDKLYNKFGDRLFIICGGAQGADEYARDWAASQGVDHLVLYAKWSRQHKAAGPIRNSRMLKYKPQLVVGFHDHIDSKTKSGKSRGTKDMLKKAERAGIKTVLKSHRAGDDDA